MKKVALLFSAVILFAGLTFAQTPQDKTAKPAKKTECVSKDSKSGCSAKEKAACAHSKEGKSCCAKDGKKPAPATATPEKK
jgi:hypothetical protein